MNKSKATTALKSLLVSGCALFVWGMTPVFLASTLTSCEKLEDILGGGDEDENWRSPSQRIAEKRDASFSIGCAGCLPSTNGNMPNGYSLTHLLPGMETSIWALHSILLKGRV